MIGLIDCNNFFASCERVFNPILEGKPVVILSNNDGCVIARSNEAKELGIGMGVPIHQVLSLIKEHNVRIYSSNYTLYADMSARVMATIKQLVNKVEVYSIDEAFIDFTEYSSDVLKEFGEQIVYTIRRNTGIPVSLGIAPTKTLAKIASKLCKKYPKYNGCCVIKTDEQREIALSITSIKDVWGVGRKYAKMLIGVGVLTALDFTQRPKYWVQSKMGVVGVRLWTELQGEACYWVEQKSQANKQIQVSRSFGTEIYAFQDIRSAFLTFAHRAMEKLRKQNSCSSSVTLYLRTNRFKNQQEQYRMSKEWHFEIPTSSTLEVNQAIENLLKDIYVEGYGYKKAGLILGHISSKEGVQCSLFDTIDRTKHSRLMNVLDTINNKFGRETIHSAGQTFNPIIKNNREYLSPSYTTKWEDILLVK